MPLDLLLHQLQGCQHCDIEKRETANFIVLCTHVHACYKKREHIRLLSLVRTSKKDTQCFTHKNRETPGKSVELVTLQLSNYECNYRHSPFPFAILLWSLGVYMHCLEWDCLKLVIASIGQCTFTCTIIILSSETCMLYANLTIVR